MKTYLEDYIKATVFQDAGQKSSTALETEQGRPGTLRIPSDPALQALCGIFTDPSGKTEIRMIARRGKGSGEWISEIKY